MNRALSCSPQPGELQDNEHALAKRTPGPLTLIVDAKHARQLESALVAHGHRMLEAATAEEALNLIDQFLPDVIVLVLPIPDMDATAAVEALRQRTYAPLLVLSGQKHIPDKVALLDAGADDCIAGPFDMAEVMARLRVAERHAAQRNSQAAPRIFESGTLRVDLMTHGIWAGGVPVHLTPTEYRLLNVLILHCNRVLTHRQLLTVVWGPERRDKIEYLRVYMRSLRNKLERRASRSLFVTECGVGYRLATEAGARPPENDAGTVTAAGRPGRRR
jgi:two-component system KDP operon response regulator KdpE